MVLNDLYADSGVGFHVSVPEEAVKLIFGEVLTDDVRSHAPLTRLGAHSRFARSPGFMGTHIQMGDVVFALSESFRVDSLGRKICVRAPTRRAAALAVVSFVYELTHTSISEASGWMYVDPNNQVHGPYPSSKITAWLKKKYFDSQMPVMLRNPVVAIWLPAFMVEALTELLETSIGIARMDTEFVSMREDDPAMDWEGAGSMEFLEDVAMARQQVSGAATNRVGRFGGVSGFEKDGFGKDVSPALESVVHQHARQAMDYDVCDLNVFGRIEKTVHVCIVLDTNVLLSHFSFLERRLGDLTCSHSKRGNVVSLILVVPWVVLCELDHLKEGRLRDAALYAIKRIHTLSSARDSFYYVQGAASHKEAAEEVALIDGQNQSLRNDDFIMQTCVFFKERLVKKLREKKHRAHCLLVTNDNGLLLRARANAIACVKAVEVEGNVDTFLDAIEARDAVVGDDEREREGEAPTGRERRDEERDGTSTDAPSQPVSHEVEDFLSSLQLQASAPELPRGPNVAKARANHAVDPNSHRSTHPAGHQTRDHQTHDHENRDRDRDRDCDRDEQTDHRRLSRSAVADAVQHGLGAFVRYMRQQDLGDLWDDLLEDELKWPGWEASDVLKVLTRHSSTFWGVFERKLLDDSKTLLRFLHPARFDAHAHECVIITKKLLHASYAAFSKPVSESQTAPDPSTIRGFISLGDAKAAVKESIETLG